MTFIVNQDGIVYQKNLGAGTGTRGAGHHGLQPGRKLDEGRSGEVSDADAAAAHRRGRGQDTNTRMRAPDPQRARTARPFN